VQLARTILRRATPIHFATLLPAHRQHRPSDFLPFSVKVPSTAAREPHGKLVVDVLIKRAGG